MSWQYFKKKGRDRYEFLHEINIKVFYKLIPSFFVTIARHAQSTQNNKFTISLQYLKEEGRVEVDFCMQINKNGPTI